MNKKIRFVQELDNEKLLWRFNIIGGMVVVGRVVDYIQDMMATPITVIVEDSDNVTMEIPWTSIQTIKLEGEQ